MRKICVLTSSRADLGILTPLCLKIENHPLLELVVVGFASHTEASYKEAFYRDTENYKSVELIESKRAGDDALSACGVFGENFPKIAERLKSIMPDIVLCLGDRYEMLGAVLSASILGLPIAHLHGGEISEGAMDDNFRHAISKLAHIHFPATRKSKERLHQMGESPDKVFNVGSLGVENVLNLDLVDGRGIRESLGLSKDRPILLGTFHPETRSDRSGLEQVITVLNGLRDLIDEYDVVFTGANTDPRGDEINNQLKLFSEENSNVYLFGNLGVVKYLSLVKECSLVFGNSSSGIIEVPSFSVPVINIGNRQAGREKSELVLDVPLDSKIIESSFKEALGTQVNSELKNPYEGSSPSDSIVETLSTIELKEICYKKFNERVSE